MGDYFTEYSSFVGNKGLPSPADTPYETPAFLRSKRSSRATTNNSSRDPSSSPPPLPSEHQQEPPEKSRDGRYVNLDPRRFTPTLHASLVSEILTLRRELDSKNNLVENLETNLSLAKNENEGLERRLAENAKEVRKVRSQVHQMEQGSYDAVEGLMQERDTARAVVEELQVKLEAAQRKTRQQDEDAQRTQAIWENDKESWDNERRQLERRMHVTESRLRAVVDEMTAQQHLAQLDEATDDFKDSGIGNESDTASMRSTSPVKHHRRNMSSISFRQRHIRMSISSRTTTATPDLYARGCNTLADELEIDEEDEYDNEEASEHGDDTFRHSAQMKFPAPSSGNMDDADPDGKIGDSSDSPASDVVNDPLESPLIESSDLQGPQRTYRDRATTPPPADFMPEPATHVCYVDAGYQPSPPVSPPRVEVTQAAEDSASDERNNSDGDDTRPSSIDVELSLQQPRDLQAKPITPPQTPVVDDAAWLQQKPHASVPPNYLTASTQTESVEHEPPKDGHRKRESLSPPAFVPAIAIHPPNSRPSSPRPYALPPGTKNAFSQANLAWIGKDACIQTEEIRVDRRPVRLPAHLLSGALLPSPTFQETPPRPMSEYKHLSASSVLIKRDSIRRPPAISIPESPAVQSALESSPEMVRNNGPRDLRHYPLKALPLPRPVLSPPAPLQQISNAATAGASRGPLNRSSQYGVSQSNHGSQANEDVDWSESSDYEDPVEDVEPADLLASMPVSSRPPLGRFGLSDPPKAVPEDKEISPERRPRTADSPTAAAPAPSISSSRAASQRRHAQPAPRMGRPVAPKDLRSRSPSFGSVASSSQSGHSAMPYPIPMRSSSRPKPHSEGSQSPTPREGYEARVGRIGRPQRQVSIRKVQSAAVIRTRQGRASPTKGTRRRRRSPNLTPVESSTPGAPTDFPIPNIPNHRQNRSSFEYIKGSVDIRSSPQSSVDSAGDENNLVDAIAGTMVGEWMWKYIRKRKSFGIGDDTMELPVTDHHGFVNVSAHGIRHKRWVWLSPYERTIMWDTKQPSSGPALLGKKGRKLAIQSVMDVPDATPLPKNPELGSAWNRSILILTPQRALKFTATTEERHNLWITALTFLAQSSQLPNQIPQMLSSQPPMPPMPSVDLDGVPVKRNRSPSFGRSGVRDSIRLTKGKRPDLQKVQSQPTHCYRTDGMEPEYHLDPDSADFPAVPRLYIGTSRHHRNRSYTNPALNLRSFSSGAVTSSASSAGQYRSTNGSTFRPSTSTKSGSRRESMASPMQQNFFEAVGTVRMEAFVDPNVRDGVLYVPAPPPVIGSQRRPRTSSNLSQSTVDKRRAGYVFDEDGMDPFKGF